MDLKIGELLVNAVGSYIGGMFVVWTAIGTSGFRQLRSRFGRPRVAALTRRAPEDFLLEIELCTPMERIREVLGTPSRKRGNMWAYRFSDALAVIYFSDDDSVLTIALAITNTDTTFEIPWGVACPGSGDLPPLGKLMLDSVIFEGEQFERRTSLRTDEVLTWTRAGPPGAWANYTFGALSPLTPGDLAPSEFEWCRESDSLITPPQAVRVNWVGISCFSGPAHFPWDIGLRNVGN